MQKILTALSLCVLSAAAMAEPAALLVYRVWEEGIDPYISRVIVTDDYVRLDEGSDDAGYSLFDRQQEILYNVSMEERAVMVMNPTDPLPEANAALLLQEQVTVDPKAPSIAGRQPKNVRLLANGETCSELVVIEGVMDDAVDALAELKLMLARFQAPAAPKQPLGMQTACDLASGIYAADRSLKFGLPIQERTAGRQQSLVDFSEDYDADASLFSLPADFERRPVLIPGAI